MSLYEYNNIDDYLKGNHDFPYKRDYTTNDEIYKMFNNLEKYNFKERIFQKKYKIKNLDIDNPNFLGKNILIMGKENDYYTFNRISDMFQEKCRMKCKIFSLNDSPYDYFIKNKKKLAEDALKLHKIISNYTIREEIYYQVKECTTFRPTNIIFFIQLFKSKSILDFSAGWGDRLIGAMSQNVEYVGVDPNPCLHPGYQEMIKFFNKSNEKYLMIEDKIETAIIPDRNYDLIFTSPPYFDLEIYTNNKKQSHYYAKENVWFENFLKVALNKCWNKLIQNGYMVININQKSNKDESYVYKMIEYVKLFGDSEYLGIISYADEKLINPQPVFIWKKYNLDFS